MYNNYYILYNINLFSIMIIIGLLSTKQEAQEIKYIANVCALEDRIHFVVRMQKIKKMLKEEHKESEE